MENARVYRRASLSPHIAPHREQLGTIKYRNGDTYLHTAAENVVYIIYTKCLLYRFNAKCNSPPTLKRKTMTCASVFPAKCVYVVHV